MHLKLIKVIPKGEIGKLFFERNRAISPPIEFRDYLTDKKGLLQK